MSLDFIVEDPLICKRKRSSRACELCRVRKVRCDGLSPQCSRCQQEQKECSYTITRKRGPKSMNRKANSPNLHQMDNDSKESGKMHYTNSSLNCTKPVCCLFPCLITLADKFPCYSTGAHKYRHRSY
jgi:hypothetical protein